MVYTLNVTHRINEPSVDGTKWRVDVDNSILERLDPTKDCEVEVKNARVSYVGGVPLDDRLHTPVQITSNSIAPNYHKNAIGKVDYLLQEPHLITERSTWGVVETQLNNNLAHVKRINSRFYDFDAEEADIHGKDVQHIFQVLNKAKQDSLVGITAEDAHYASEKFDSAKHYFWPMYVDSPSIPLPQNTHQSLYNRYKKYGKVWARHTKPGKFKNGAMMDDNHGKINYVKNCASSAWPKFAANTLDSDGTVTTFGAIDNTSGTAVPGKDDHVGFFHQVYEGTAAISPPERPKTQIPLMLTAAVSSTADSERLFACKFTSAYKNDVMNAKLEMSHHGLSVRDAFRKECSCAPIWAGMEVYQMDTTQDKLLWAGQISPKNWETGGPFEGEDWGYGKGSDGAATIPSDVPDKTLYIVNPDEFNWEKLDDTFNLIIDNVEVDRGSVDVDGSGKHPYAQLYPVAINTDILKCEPVSNTGHGRGDDAGNAFLYVLLGVEFARLKRVVAITHDSQLEAEHVFQGITQKLVKHLNDSIDKLEIPEIRVTRDNRSVIANCDFAQPWYNLHQREPTKFSCAPPRWGTMEFGLRQTFEHEDFWKYNSVGAVEVSFDLCFY